MGTEKWVFEVVRRSSISVPVARALRSMGCCWYGVLVLEVSGWGTRTMRCGSGRRSVGPGGCGS